MSAASRGGNGAVSALLRNSRRVCSQCTRPPPATPSLARRYSEATTTTTTTETPTPTADDFFVPPPTTTTETPITADDFCPPDEQPSGPRYRIKAGLILSRPPLLTRTPTTFESAFYLYQKRLNERLAAPFRAALYFPKDTARSLDWRIKARERHGVAAKDIGRYNPRGRLGWNDEVLVGSTTSTPEYIVDRLLTDAEVRVSEDGEEMSAEDRVPVERPMARRSKADEEGDVRRLDRRMDETLYLVVKSGEGEEARWGFPAGNVTTSEALHQTAKRVLAESAGVNMNTWIVGRVPIAHHVTEFEEAQEEAAPVKEAAPAEEKAAEDEKESDESRFAGEKIFYLKGRIMAGQVDLKGNKYGYTDFKWVNKDELRETLYPTGYWKSVRNMVELR
ncbi:39S mitochondrial ribosomal protein L46-domain-containing protein [Podospora conica]|nr:39S mitochondrial ribosomal protein L46-domain-containing protein [Schizothecium conicum]